MRLLLRRSVEHVGRIGEIVNVSDGFGRNYLLPQRLAVSVTPDNKRLIEFEKVEEAKREAARKESAETLGRTIDAIELEILAKAQDDGTLYGSITPHQIRDKVKQVKDLVLDVKQLKIAEPIRKVGNHEVEVKLHSEVSATLRVRVIREGEDD